MNIKLYFYLFYCILKNKIYRIIVFVLFDPVLKSKIGLFGYFFWDVYLDKSWKYVVSPENVHYLEAK